MDQNQGLVIEENITSFPKLLTSTYSSEHILNQQL